MADHTWQVSAGSDDGDRRKNGTSGEYFRTPFTTQMAGYSTAQYSWSGGVARFLNVTIPPGSLINEARLILRASATKSDTVVNCRLRAEKNINPATFIDNDIPAFDARTWTTAFVHWDNLPTWVLNTQYSSPDIKAVIQEIVNMPGWVSGNPIVILWDDFEERSTIRDANVRIAHAYENVIDPGYVPKLYVDYTEVLSPTLSTDPATDVAPNSSTLNGTLDDDGGMACDCGFEWGETAAYGNTTPTQSRTTGQAFSQAISGLILGTTYHFRAFATNGAGTTYGADRTFTTVPVASTVTTDPATALSAIAATLNGTLDDDGGEACECGFEWGLDTGYGTTTPPQSKTTGETFSQVIGGLSPGTTYHFRAFATNSVGTSYGADSTFGTALLMSRAYSLERRQL